MPDLEKNVSSMAAELTGFPAHAAFLSRDPDGESYVFRRFSNLTARTLLHLQSELIGLERDLAELDRKAMGSDSIDLRMSIENWEWLTKKAAEQDGDERKLKDLADEIKSKLDQYHKALLQATQIAQLGRPSERVLTAYKNEFADRKLRGPSRDILEDRIDLAALKKPPDKDLLSDLLREHWPFPTKRLSNSAYQQAEHFEERWLSAITATLSVAIAAILLIGSILALYWERRPNVRLGLLIMFIGLFAIGIRISTSATRDSIFAATAAYAAVLVVFVSGNLGNS